MNSSFPSPFGPLPPLVCLLVVLACWPLALVRWPSFFLLLTAPYRILSLPHPPAVSFISFPTRFRLPPRQHVDPLPSLSCIPSSSLGSSSHQHFTFPLHGLDGGIPSVRPFSSSITHILTHGLLPSFFSNQFINPSSSSHNRRCTLLFIVVVAIAAAVVIVLFVVVAVVIPALAVAP